MSPRLPVATLLTLLFLTSACSRLDDVTAPAGAAAPAASFVEVAADNEGSMPQNGPEDQEGGVSRGSNGGMFGNGN
jgi:hypothetical protein